MPNSKPKIAIIEFPGSNCETESIYAVREAGMEAYEFLWNRQPSELVDFDGYFIIGGFSYEDRSRSGVISAKNPLMQELIKQAKLGKPIIGVCNGAQILIESGLVPGLKDEQIGGALAVNVRKQDGHVVGTGFYNIWCSHKVVSRANIFMKNFEDSEIFEMPIAHGEGRFVFPPDVLETMQARNQILFKYCNKAGEIVNNFPINPNGTVDNIAAIGNPSGNVIAMMPHPERSKIAPKFFEAMREYIQENNFFDHHLEQVGSGGLGFSDQSLVTTSEKSFAVGEKVRFDYKTLDLALAKKEIEKYEPLGQQLIIQSVITDKEANTINQTLKDLGIEAIVSQMAHWEMDSQVDLQAIIKSEELFNPNKENIVTNFEGTDKGSTYFYLVSYIDNIAGQSKKEILQAQGITVEFMIHSVLWKIDGDHQAVLDSNILANPYSQRVVRY